MKKILSHILCASIFLGAFSLPAIHGDTALIIKNQEMSLQDSYILDFSGDPIHSFFPRRRLFFSLDSSGNLWKYLSPSPTVWSQKEIFKQGVKASSVGSNFILVLLDDGKLIYQNIYGESWNWDESISFGQETVIANGVSFISAGYDHYLYITELGILMGAGYDAGDGRFGGNVERTVATPIQIASSVKTASAGQGFTLYITHNGTLWAMGANHYGQLGFGEVNPIYSATAIAQNVEKVQGERNAIWYIDNKNTLFWAGSFRAYYPTPIADNVDHAAIDGSSAQIVWLDGKLGEAFSASLSRGSFPGGQEYPVSYSLGKAYSVSALSGLGYLVAREGRSLFRFKSFKELQDEVNPFSVVAEGSRFMTTNPDEISLFNKYLNWDGLNHFVAEGPLRGAKPVYRFLNQNYLTHFYTISDEERLTLIDNPNWNMEGVAFFAWDYPKEGTEPVYRYFSPVTRSHYYAIGEAEKAQLISDSTELAFQYEGIAYWAISFFGTQK